MNQDGAPNKSESAQMSLFDFGGFAEQKEEKRLPVFEMDYKCMLEMTEEDLFSGYEDLKVVTYSYSLPFVEKIFKNFHTGEMIIGTDRTLTAGMAELFAVQSQAVQEIRKYKYLQEQMQEGNFQVWLSERQSSHQKIYLLKGEGKYRTIFGSANMSAQAWGGCQLENLYFCDGEQCYLDHLKAFESLRDQASDNIAKNAEEAEMADGGGKTELSVLPVMKKTEKGGAVLLETAEKHEEPEKQYVFTIRKKTTEMEEILKAVRPTKDNKGRVWLDTATKKKIQKAEIKLKQKEQRQKVENPPFVLDLENRIASFDGIIFDLQPSDVDIRNDLVSVTKYMDGFSDLPTGDQEVGRGFFTGV